MICFGFRFHMFCHYLEISHPELIKIFFLTCLKLCEMLDVNLKSSQGLLDVDGMSGSLVVQVLNARG